MNRKALAIALSISFAAWLGGASPVLAGTHIHVGDKLLVTVFNHADLSVQASVASSGDVTVPLAGTVRVEGLSEQNAAARIETALAAYLPHHPTVEVRVLQEGQSVFFTGFIVGVQAYQPGETLGSAIANITTQPRTDAALDATRFGSIDLHSVRIERGSSTGAPIDVESLGRRGEAGPRLEPGDTVILIAKPVRVDVKGDVKTPSTIYVYQGETLNQAINAAGGYQATSSLINITLLRDGTERAVSAAGPEISGPAADGDVVTLHPAAHVSVVGSVEKPGDTTLQAGSTLLSALYSAGGPNKYADLRHIRVIHGSVQITADVSSLTHGDLSQDVAVHDGDVIFVPEGHKIDAGGFLQALTALKYLVIR